MSFRQPFLKADKGSKKTNSQNLQLKKITIPNEKMGGIEELVHKFEEKC